MLGRLLVGTAAAVCHHLFYRSLNGQATHSTPWDQQVNIDIGTGLAFLLKSLLVMAVGTAYVQVFWKDLQVRSENIAVVDSMFRLRSNLLDFFGVRLVSRHLLLIMIGLVSW